MLSVALSPKTFSSLIEMHIEIVKFKQCLHPVVKWLMVGQ